MSTEPQSSFLGMLLRRHPALLFSALYVIASTIGMVFSWDYLRRFGINVFNYAQIGDFLLASLKEPMTWGLVFLAVLMAVVDNAVSRRWQKRDRSAWTRWYGSPKYRLLNYVVALFMVVWFIDIYAGLKARHTYEGKGQVIQYQVGEETRDAIMLGTTAQFIFLFDANTEKVFVHPHESIAEISFVAPGDE